MAGKVLFESEYVQVFEPNEVIFNDGDASKDMYVILKGKVEINKSIGNTKQVLSTFKEGEFFGEMSTFRDKPRTANAIAIERCECFRITPAQLVQSVSNYPEVALKIIKTLCNRIENADNQIEKFVLLISIEEVIRYFIDLSTNNGKNPFKPIAINYKEALTTLTKQTKASKQNIETALNVLTIYGLIQVKKESERVYSIIINEKILQYFRQDDLDKLVEDYKKQGKLVNKVG